jgi:hypothetical protein
MSYNRAQIVSQALTNLSILAEGQAASDSDVSKMDGIVNGAFATLAALNIYTVADYGNLGPVGGNIEDEAFLPLATWLARKACEAFNQPADEKMETELRLAVADLVTIAAPPRSKARLSVEPALRGNGSRGASGRWPNNG